jgi:hypothetical protein
VSSVYVPPPLSTNGVTLSGQQPAPMPAVPPRLPQTSTLATAPTSGGGDRSILASGDPARISQRIQDIFSNRSIGLEAGAETAEQRLARLTREVQAGRSFDDLRRSADIIAANQPPPSLDSLQPATPPEYPTTPLPLSPEVDRILRQRRFEADMDVARAEADLGLVGDRARTQAGLQLTDIERWQDRTMQDTQRRLAARGVARSPMFANPAQRQVFEESSRAAGEVRFSLANTLSELERALREAQTRRAAELGEIEQDRGVAESDVNRLLGAS